MKKPLAALGATLLISTSSLALAAGTAELAVVGSITPSACGVLISSGGMVDFGRMSSKTLNDDQPTPLPRQTLHLSVRCEGATFFTLSTIDNRAGSSAHHDNWHGLGMTPSSEKIGGAYFGLHASVADGASVRTLVSWDNGGTWQLGNGLGPTTLTAIETDPGTMQPGAVAEFDAEIGLYTHIAPAASLTLTDEVPVDGHATVQLKYL
ncbi:DUF1120 domain-containing protein [Pseudomonas sp. T1.Ur]|uniref:DUF1120 domain-containing protein n=1 Tax=Pseudomonas sp. T1.Ur TaxID=2928704 RepID=UPI00201E3DE6|nr:DUF1120 domain-containing protein [Pseudomonas sp. T1.Ur]MCL6703637.1 DUF1120 domain-containing protein [Pseudomonas sp. T1.Ur]